MQTDLKFKISADASGMQQGISQVTSALTGLGQKAGEIGGMGKTAAGAFASSIESLGRSVTNFATNPLGAMKGAISELLDKLGPMAVGVGALAGGIGLAAKMLWDFGAAAADDMERLVNLSAQTRLSTQKLQALAQIAKEAGLESLDLGRTIGMLNAQLAKGEGDFTEALNKLGIAMMDIATGKPKDAIALLDEMRAKLLAIEDPTERAQTAQAALGGRLRELIPLLLNSESSLSDMTAELEKTNVVTDELTKEGLLRFDQQMDKLSRVWTGFMNLLKGAVGGILAATIGEFEKLAIAAGWLGDKLHWVGEKLHIVGPKMEETKNQTENFAKATDEAAGSMTFFNISEEKWIAINNEATGSTKKHTDEIKRLKEETENALAPMDNLSVKIQDQINLGFSKHQIVKLYSDQILNASQKQYELTGKLTDGQRELAAIALGFKLAEERAKGMAGGFSLADEMGEGLNHVLTDMKAKVEQVSHEIVISDRVFNDFIASNDTLNESVLDVDDAIKRTDKSLEDIQGETKRSKDTMNDFGRAVSTTLTNMTQDIAEKVTKWAGPFQDFAKAALSALLEGLFNPLMKWLTKIGNAIGDWLGGLLTGGGGGGLLGKGLGSLFGIGAGAGTAAAAGGGAAAVGGAGAAGAGGAAAGGGGSVMGSIGAFLTNPITIAVAASALLGYGLYKWIKGPNSYQAAAEEAQRDFGVSLSDKHMKSLFDAVGVSEPNAWDIRKSLLSSPVGILFMAKFAEENGILESFTARLANIQTSWGTFNFKEGFLKGLESGDWSALNDAYVAAFSGDKKLNEKLPNWRSVLLLPNTGSAASASEEEEAPSYAVGTNYVPRTGLYRLHEGEAVIPARENSAKGMTINYYQNISVPVHSNGSDDMLQNVKTKVIPILKREMVGGNTGLREAVRAAYDRTAGAY